MPASGDLATLVSRARESDGEAFATLVARAESALLPGAATVVGSIAQLQAAARCTVVEMRHGLSACPVSPAAYVNWVETILLQQLNELMPRAIRREVPGEDDLSRLVGQAGLQAMRQDGAGTLQLARLVRQRIRALPASDRSMIDARYRHLQSLDALAEGVGRSLPEVALELCRIRAGLHPEATVSIPTPARALVLEMALASKPGTEERRRLMADLAKEERSSGMVERQARIHLLLQSLLLPVDQERTRRLAAAVGVTPQSAYPDTMEESFHPHQLDSQVTFGEAQVRKGRVPSSDHYPQPQPGPHLPQAPHRQSDLEQPAAASRDLQVLERNQRLAIRLIMGGILAVGLLILGIMWWSSGDDGRAARSLPDAVAAAPSAALAAMAPSRAGGRPSGDTPRLFMRGVNFGGGAVTIAGCDWMSTGQAMDHGLTIQGRSTYCPEGLDEVAPDMATMLGTGLTGNGGMVTINQDLAPAWYEIHLWVANAMGYSGRSVLIEAGLERLAVPAAFQPARWREVTLPPVRAGAVPLAVAISGLESGDYVAGIAYHLIGNVEGQEEPLRIAYPLTGMRLKGEETVPILVLPGGAGPPLTGMSIRLLGTGQTTAPEGAEAFPAVCSRNCQVTELGPLRLVAVGRRADGSTVQSAPFSIEASCEGALLEQWWDGMAHGKETIEVLRRDPRFPDRPDRETLLQGTLRNPDCGGACHARRIRGYLTPPMDGRYQFGLCSDNGCEVYLSADETPASQQLILEVKGSVNDGEWDRQPGQRSPAIVLQAGRRYYIDILHQQDGGGEVLHLGWTRPDGVVERPVPIRHFTPLRLPQDTRRPIAQRLAAAAAGGLLDGIPGAALAFSTRRLSAGYAGALVELRRSSDHQARSWFPDGTGWLSRDSGDGTGATLGAWKGDGALRVVRWFDQSGNQRHALAPEQGVEAGTAGDAHLLMAFDGRQRLLTQEVTAEQLAGPDRHDALTLCAALRFHGGRVWFQAELPDHRNRLGWETADRWDYPNDAGMSGWKHPLLERLQVASFRVRQQERQVRIDGGMVRTDHRQETLRDGQGRAALGAQTGGRNGAVVDIGELIIFSRALDDQELVFIEESQRRAFAIRD